MGQVTLDLDWSNIPHSIKFNVWLILSGHQPILQRREDSRTIHSQYNASDQTAATTATAVVVH